MGKGEREELEEGICNEDCCPPHKRYHSIKAQLKCPIPQD